MSNNNTSTASTGSPEVAAPTTPEATAAALPISPSTPTVHKQSTTLPYTSGHVMRDETLIVLGSEMAGYTVGPMSSERFLDFLPPTRRAPSFRKKLFAKLANHKVETAMYEPFIEAMASFCPNLKGVNTSATPMLIFSGKVIKPDITYYNSSAVPTKSDAQQAEMMVEAKIHDQDDPFEDLPSDKAKGFLQHTDRGRQTLGQLTSYATAHLAAQFCTHVFSVLLFRKSARLMRWDRAGVIFSELIPLDTSTLTEFFWRFNNADAKDRGHDPTVSPFKFTNDLTKEFLFDQLQFTTDPGDAKVEDVNFFEVLLPREKRRYIIGKAAYLGVASLASRATRSFKAWCLTTKKPVFLKDTWRIVSGSQRPEHEIYKKLANAKVKHIATVLDYSDIENHRTITGDYATPGDTNLKVFRTLQHYRLVLQEIGRNLTSFDDFREVLTAMRDALQAHRESYYDGRVLHRDISCGNIVIYNGGGLLIDWDMSKDLDWKSDDKNISRTGTWAFQSVRLAQLPKSDLVQVHHNRLDDLESFYHVLFWVSLQHAPHGLNPEELYNTLTKLFDDAVIVKDKAYGDFTKKVHMQSSETLEMVQFKTPPLLQLLLDISDTLATLYKQPRKRNVVIQSILSPSAEKAEQDYQRELQTHQEYKRLLHSEEYSNWMEVRFEKALQNPAEEWGPTGYIVNEKTPSVLNPAIKRRYSDMTTSMLGYSQGGNFSLSEPIVKEEDESEEEEEEEDEPLRTRRRVD